MKPSPELLKKIDRAWEKTKKRIRRPVEKKIDKVLASGLIIIELKKGDSVNFSEFADIRKVITTGQTARVTPQFNGKIQGTSDFAKLSDLHRIIFKADVSGTLTVWWEVARPPSPITNPCSEVEIKITIPKNKT